VLQRQREEQVFAVLALREQFRDRVVVVVSAGDRLVEDRRIGRQAGHVVLSDVFRQRALVEHAAGDVVQPDALAEVVQLLRRVHGCSVAVAGFEEEWPEGETKALASRSQSSRMPPSSICAGGYSLRAAGSFA